MFLYKREMHIVVVRLVEVLVVVLYSIKGFYMVLYDHLSVRLPLEPHIPATVTSHGTFSWALE
jgi:hypothetical protein